MFFKTLHCTPNVITKINLKLLTSKRSVFFLVTIEEHDNEVAIMYSSLMEACNRLSLTDFKGNLFSIHNVSYQKLEG